MLIAWLVAQAVVTPPGLAAPDRLTAGPANKYLGALTADGAELYFASDEESTTQIYVQEVTTGVPKLAFDEVADVTWPRPSPDGQLLLYISYREDAAGDLCVRQILGARGARRLGERRCLSAPDSAELQAVWFPDSRRVALVTRAGLHGDFELREVTLRGAPARTELALGAALAPGNLANPAISPDGRTLLAVPVQRASRQIGPSFLGRSTGELSMFSLVDRAAPARRLAFDLPGTTAMPAFSADGKWIYFSQFLNDTSFDGAIDGGDNGVLFRVPVSEDRTLPPEQLSSARWSCQYPLPGRELLVATCMAEGSLDVFSLPPGGALPAAWAALPAAERAARIDDELAATRDRWERLLLLAHRGDAPPVLREMIRLHLALGEYESASFYAAKLEKAGGEEAAAGAALRELAAHRRAERSLARGSLSAPFVAAARKRLAAMTALRHPLAHLVRSEILDTLGQEDATRTAFALAAALPKRKAAPKGTAEPPELGPLADPLVAALWADRLLALYRDDPAYFERYQPLAETDLGHAETFTRELLRGVPRAERAARIDTWLGKVDAYSELAFLLQLERALADLSDATQEQVRERVFLLYRQNKDLARRKALVAATVRRSLAAGNHYLLYNFAESWVSYVPRERAERRRAEHLYRDAVFERAYLEEAQGNKSDARGHYYGVTLQTESLEAHAAFIENRLAEGNDPRKDYPGSFSAVVNGYARAYLAARTLPELAARKGDAAHRQAAEVAVRELRAIAGAAPQRAEVHQLWGFVALQRFAQTRARSHAVEANAHLLVALDLARASPRARAAALDGLAQVQAAVGNWGLAQGFLEQRAKLPFATLRAKLAHCMSSARADYHLGDDAAAAAKCDGCLAMIEGSAELARFAPLALDRSALYHLGAGHAAKAVARYAALWPLVEVSPADAPANASFSAKERAAEAARNRLTTRLGQAAAALASGAPKDALTFVDHAERLLGTSTPAPRHGAYGLERGVAPLSREGYRLLLLGLRAQAQLAAGQLAPAARTLTARCDGVAKRLKSSELDEDRLELALCLAQRYETARRLGQPVAEALPHLRAAWRSWRAWSEATGTPVEETGLAILVSFAELHLLVGISAKELGFDLAAQLDASYVTLSAVRNPAWEPLRDRLATYLTMMKLRSGS